MDERADAMRTFLERAGWDGARAHPLAGDASARRYVRLVGDGGRAVLMDADPADAQDVRPFRRIAAHLRDAGFSAPEVIAADDAAGFLLLEDLGDGVFARLAEAEPSREEGLYSAAIDMLLALRDTPVPEGLTLFTPAHMAGMIGPVFDWYAGPLGVDVSEDARLDIRSALETVLDGIAEQDAVLCLRDCHAENLMWLPGRAGVARVGLLDFQDAVAAHPGYDVASLLQDARRDVPAALSHRMIARYTQASGDDPDGFAAAMCAMGAQRHLRILGVFGRLALQHGKAGYVALMPRVWGHLQTCLAHPALHALAARLEILPEPTKQALSRMESHVAA